MATIKIKWSDYKERMKAANPNYFPSRSTRGTSSSPTRSLPQQEKDHVNSIVMSVPPLETTTTQYGDVFQPAELKPTNTSLVGSTKLPDLLASTSTTNMPSPAVVPDLPVQPRVRYSSTTPQPQVKDRTVNKSGLELGSDTYKEANPTCRRTSRVGSFPSSGSSSHAKFDYSRGDYWRPSTRQADHYQLARQYRAISRSRSADRQASNVCEPARQSPARYRSGSPDRNTSNMRQREVKVVRDRSPKRAREEVYYTMAARELKEELKLRNLPVPAMTNKSKTALVERLMEDDASYKAAMRKKHRPSRRKPLKQDPSNIEDLGIRGIPKSIGGRLRDENISKASNGKSTVVKVMKASSKRKRDDRTNKTGEHEEAGTAAPKRRHATTEPELPAVAPKRLTRQIAKPSSRKPSKPSALPSPTSTSCRLLDPPQSEDTSADEKKATVSTKMADKKKTPATKVTADGDDKQERIKGIAYKVHKLKIPIEAGIKKTSDTSKGYYHDEEWLSDDTGEKKSKISRTQMQKLGLIRGI
ncbi:hypothetical protein CC80DRAFT_501703 [Byssothecium circinans]|uniref:Uncharacterized protein n=1 Tax=Byssothecium circinans TaxID=147558 RepID=A0A6A5UEF2_9PLEO|nr:hypothetical protein CC80DRAFT_501703 [Byssothecium circinans]